MTGKLTYEMKQERAYSIAEADGFRQHPDVYWHQVEVTVSAPKKAPRSKGGKDKLTVVEGIGPKIASLLNQDGIMTFADLAGADISRLEKILKDAGPRFAMHKPGSWPQQASLARDGKMDELKALQDTLDGGR